MHTSRSAALVAAALVFHAHPPLRKHELVRITGMRWSAVERGITSLSDRGLVRSNESKGYRTYEIDPATPYLPALRAAALVDCGIVEALLPIALRLRFVMVIGSFAWGRPVSASDVDLLVIGGVDRATVDAALSPLASRYERTFDTIVRTDEQMHASLTADDYLLRNAISSGIRIMGDPGLVPSPVRHRGLTK
jgi:predicted nucleotidyltransferase